VGKRYHAGQWHCEKKRKKKKKKKKKNQYVPKLKKFYKIIGIELKNKS